MSIENIYNLLDFTKIYHSSIYKLHIKYTKAEHNAINGK